MTPTSEVASASPDPRPPGDPAQGEGRSPSSHDGSSVTGSSPATTYAQAPLRGVYGPREILNHAAYHQQARAQGLTNLMEAALAPQDQFSFTPLDQINPSMWDGFMRFGEQTNMYMGSYDADMSWTLDYLPSENSPSYLWEPDMLGALDEVGDGTFGYQQMQPPYEQPPAVEPEDADGDEEDTSDWPDKVDKPAAPKRFAPRVVPIRKNRPISWQSVLDEARVSGWSAGTIRPMHSITDQLRNNLLDTLNESLLRNELSRPEISDALFPPAEVLDYFLRLYVRFLQPRYPVLHLPTFNLYNSPPLMLVAMMLLGSSHSNADAGRFSRIFHEPLRIACMRKQEVEKTWVRRSPDPAALAALANVCSYGASITFSLTSSSAWLGRGVEADTPTNLPKVRAVSSSRRRGGPVFSTIDLPRELSWSRINARGDRRSKPHGWHGSRPRRGSGSGYPST